MVTEPGSIRIPRPRLVTRIQTALDAGCVLVVAPAGYGKTVALEAALRGSGRPLAWHACRPRDADPGRLLVGVLEAVRRAVPGAADVLLEQLAEPGMAVDPAALVPTLLDDLGRLLVEPLALVLDDAEAIADAPAALALVEELLDGTDGALRVVIAARRRPRLRLAKRAAAGRVVELREADLAFDAEECAALLTARAGRDVDEAEVVEAMDRTLGWALGLAVGLEGRGEDELARFLAEEVLDRLDATARAALLDSSVFEELTPAELAVVGLGDELLAEAGRLGLAVQAVVGREDAFAWHPLVRDALRVRWRAERPAPARAALLHRAAEVLMREGRATEAIERWLEAGRGREALDAMLTVSARIVRTSPALLRGWLDALPAELRGEPAARALEGELTAGAGRYPAAVEHLRAAVPGLYGEAADAALVMLLESMYFSGLLDEPWPEIELLREPERLAGRPLALVAAAWLSAHQVARGDVDGGRALAARILATPGSEIASELAGGIIEYYVAAPSGGHDAVLAGMDARDRAGTMQFPEITLSMRAFLEVDVGRPEETLRQNARILAEAEITGLRPVWNALSFILSAWVLGQAGRFGEAEVALSAVEGSEPDSWASGWVDATRALAAAARGEPDRARASAEAALAHAEAAPVPLRDLLVLSVVPALAAAGARDRAATVLEDALAFLADRLAPQYARYHRARLLAQRAWLRHAAGDQEGAAADVREALAGLGSDPDGAGADPQTAPKPARRGSDPVRAANLLRVEWPRLREPVWDLLAAGRLDAAEIVALAEAAFAGGPEVLDLAEHPAAAVRAAVAPVVAASGHPSAPQRLKALAGDAAPEVAAAAAATAGGRAEPPARTITLLGRFALRRGEWEVDERTWGRPTVARLVRFLAVNRGAPVPEEVILEALWPERPPGSARSALQVAASRARQVLDPPGAAESAIRYADRAYRLVLAEGDRVDSERFAAAARQALELRGPARRAALDRAAALWTGDPLPEERYADWAAPWREELVTTYHRVVSALAAEHRAAGDELAALAAGRRLVTLDPLDEGAHRLLMQAFARTGRRALALRQFLACRRALVENLGLEPSDETVALQRRVLAGQPV